MKNVRFFLLFLTFGLATVVFSSCSKDDDPKHFDEGVVINGVKWATRNVAAPGTFAAKPEDAGLFYQWNRKTAWPATGEIAGWDSNVPSGDAWEKVNDPCPVGWRVPTFAEIQKLLDINKVSSEWVTQNGIAGRKFTDKVTGHNIFLPAAGCRYFYDGALYDVGSYGRYWISTVVGSGDAYYLYFDSGYAYRGYGYHSFGRSVRAVAEY